MISHEKRCIFVHIPKTAGTSIEKAMGHLDGHMGRGMQDHRSVRVYLMPYVCLGIFKHKDNLMEIARWVKHSVRRHRNINNNKTVTKEQFENYFKFTFVRNPWARAHSWYNNLLRDNVHFSRRRIPADISFYDYLLNFRNKDPLLRSQLSYIHDFDHHIPMDFIGRFEHLDRDFNKVCAKVGLSGIELPHFIKGSGEDYRNKYDNKTIDLVYHMYQEEIELFGYKFD